MESEVCCPVLADAAFMSPFDLTMSYRRDADVWVPYLPQAARLLAPAAVKTESSPAVYIASNANDRSGRHAYVAELMRHLPVDCYGACHRNRTLADDDGQAAKLATIARYRFTLAFENSIARDYVTEKFYDALIAGSVPVVLGAPNVGEFAPADPSYVDVNDFPSPAGPRVVSRRARGRRVPLCGVPRVEVRRIPPRVSRHARVGRGDPWTRLARRLAG